MKEIKFSVRHDDKKLVHKALSGEYSAITELINRIQDYIFNLSLRFLWHPEDARDATQEILLKVVTHLKTFRFESTFETWSLRIARNYLINTKKTWLEKQEISFDVLESRNQLQSHVLDFATEIENEMIEKDIKIACTHAMLICLNRDQRMTFILGCILKLNSTQAAKILEITPQTFRKRLSRSREHLNDFVKKKCGLLDKKNPCTCVQKSRCKVNLRMAEPYIKISSELSRQDKQNIIQSYGENIEELERLSLIFQDNPDYKCPPDMQNKLKALFQGKLIMN